MGAWVRGWDGGRDARLAPFRSAQRARLGTEDATSSPARILRSPLTKEHPRAIDCTTQPMAHGPERITHSP